MKYNALTPLELQGLEACHAAIEETLKELLKEFDESDVVEGLAAAIAMGEYLNPVDVRTALDEHLKLDQEFEESGLESGADDWGDNASRPVTGFRDDLGGSFDEGCGR